MTDPTTTPDELRLIADQIDAGLEADEPDEEAIEEALADAEWEATPTELAPDVEHEIADLDDRPILVEAFAGIGGVGLGFERAGFQSAVQIEWDAAASRVLAARFPRAARFGDVRKVDGLAVRRALGGRRVAVLAGGFPCQDLSVAGKRAGLAGERSGLYGELLRLFEELTPDWLVVENVPGLLSSEKGTDFARFLGDVTGWEPDVPDGGWRNSGVAHGPRATAAWRVLDARYFGVAQRRRRVFVVVHSGDRIAPAAVLLEPSGLRRHPAARVPSWAGAAEGVVGAAVRGRDLGADGGGEGDPAPRVTADEGVISALTQGLGSGGPVAEHAHAGWLVPGDPEWEAPEDVAPTLLAGPTSPASHGKRSGDDRQAFAVARPVGSVEAHGGDAIAPTVTSKWAKGSGGPAGSETGNLVVEQPEWAADVAPTLQAGGNDTGGTRPPGTTVDTVESLVVVGDGGTEVAHPVTASGTDGMGRGVPAVAYGVTAKGNGEAYLSEEEAPTLASGGGMPGQGYGAVLEPAPAYIIDKERGLPNPDGISVEPTDVAPTITADGDPAERTDRGLRIPQSFIIEPESGQGADLVVREADHSPALTAMHANERGIRVAYPISQDALRGAGKADTPSADAEGRVRLRDPGLGVYDDGDPSPTVVSAGPPAVGTVGTPDYGSVYADATQADTAQALRVLRDAIGAKATAEWVVGVVASLRSAEVLRPGVPVGGLHGPGADGPAGMGGSALPSEEVGPAGAVRDLRDTEGDGRPPPRREPPEQPAGEPDPHLSVLPHEGAQAGAYLLALSAAPQGARLLLDALSALAELGRPVAGRTTGSEVKGVSTAPRSAVRRLTPRLRECERLQGFPDDWTLVPGKDGKPQADSPRYKQLGNAVCATVSEWAACRIADYDDGTLYEDLPA